MTTKLIIIIGVSIAMVVGMFVMGKFLDRTSSDDSKSENENK